MYDRPPTPRRTTGFGTCDDCGRRVLYALTDKHRRIIAIDPDPDPAGNQAVSVKEQTYWTRQLTLDRPRAEDREVLRKPHFASCPTARAKAAARRRTPHRANFGVRPVRWQR
ncbi:hypothetical protein ACKI10_43245 [Streptomyces galilaeus]|uniref:Uncharacterized protein n=1 Tax=Streptomyces galilaeus TaxID=33899 RepID=A0ABW9IZ03_STRGJ